MAAGLAANRLTQDLGSTRQSDISAADIYSSPTARQTIDELVGDVARNITGTLRALGRSLDDLDRIVSPGEVHDRMMAALGDAVGNDPEVTEAGIRPAVVAAAMDTVFNRTKGWSGSEVIGRQVLAAGERLMDPKTAEEARRDAQSRLTGELAASEAQYENLQHSSSGEPKLEIQSARSRVELIKARLREIALG